MITCRIQPGVSDVALYQTSHSWRLFIHHTDSEPETYYSPNLLLQRLLQLREQSILVPQNVVAALEEEIGTEPRFHLQLIHRTWVIWGYGTDRHFVEHIAPAVVTVHPHPDLSIDISFELPKPYPGGEQPTEYERRTCWGWTFRSNDLIHDCGWNLAETREQAIEDATVWAKTQERVIVQGLEDIREYSCFFD